MSHKKLAVFLILALALIQVGCTYHNDRTHGEYRVVTQIDVLYQRDTIISEGNFTDPEKMQRILWYFRKITPYGTPSEDPELVHGSHFYVTLRYSDNTQKVYHQCADRFMRVDNGPWKRIDSKRAVLLSRILATMDSDTTATVPFLTPPQIGILPPSGVSLPLHYG